MKRIVVKRLNGVKRISPHCVGRRGYSPPFSIYSRIWEMHLSDADSWPSVPHAHSRNGEYKMNVWTGEVFEIPSRRFIGSAKEKELGKLHRDDRFRKFAKRAILTHRELYPDHQFTVPDWFMPLLYSMQHHLGVNDNETLFFMMSIYIDNKG